MSATTNAIKIKDQIAAKTVNATAVDETVKTMLRTKFKLGLFESELHIASFLAL
jgi:hypothetical protein